MEDQHHVLIIDDEVSILRSLGGFLSDSGFLVTLAETGEEALELFRHTVFDVAIVDLRLAGINGETLILRASSISPDTVFFIHTGTVDYELSGPLLKIGMGPEHVLYKPVINIKGLAEQIKKMITK